ncbi:Ig-like domain-containing protein [Methanosarcina sp. Mfa9]|uniref:Ig-like domain-containing protein n=1 Tax=Methanosarcina sp. Mfa9 TaxID=3439063 RepID=UPI003F84D1EA
MNVTDDEVRDVTTMAISHGPKIINPVPENNPDLFTEISGPESRTLEMDTFGISGSQLDVLLVGADYSANSLTSILTGFPDIGTVTFFNAAEGTPTLAELQQYDVAIVWSNYPYYDKVALGDVLADYVDSGGNVIIQVGSWYGPDFGLQGRIISEGYSPFVQDGVNGNHFSDASLGLYDASHPIMKGVNSVSDYYRDSVELTSRAELVAKWDDGEEFIATKDSVVGINSWPGDYYQWTGDYPTILHNTILWFNPVKIHSPQAITNDSTPLLNATFNPKTFNPAALAWYVLDGNNGTNQTNTYNLTVTLPQLDDGMHNITVYAMDSEGNTSEKTLDFLVDTIIPTITIDPVASPTDSSFQVINGTFVEEGAGIASIVVNGVSAAVNKENNSYSATGLPLVEGENLITVLATDKAGNIGTNTTLIVLDTILPTATISAPVNNACVRGTVELIGNATDEAHFNNYSVDWSDASGVNWTEIYNSTTACEGTLAVWNTTALTDGEYIVRLTVTDKASNTKTSTSDVKVDNELPIAAIAEPIEGAHVCGNISINGSADDENLKNYTVEWLNSTTNSTIFGSSTGLSGELAEWDTGALADGEYTVLLTVMDIEDNVSTAAVNVTIDNTFPVLNIAEPARDRTWFVDNIVKGTVSDSNFESATLLVKNETDALVSRYELNILPDNSFRERVEYYPEQLNTLELIACDTAGNTNISSKTVYVENNTMQEAVSSVNESEAVEIDSVNETGTSIEFVSDVNATNVTFTVTAITNKTAMESLNNSSSVFGELAVGKMVEINATGGLDGSNESQVGYVRISLFYSKDDLDLDGNGEIGPGDIDEASLTVYWYNDTSGNWTKLLKGSPEWVLDAGRSPLTGDGQGSVWVKVKHLSSYSLTGALIPELIPAEPEEHNGGHGFGHAVIISNSEASDVTEQDTGTVDGNGSGLEITPEEQEIQEDEILGEEAPDKDTPEEEESEGSPGFGSIFAAAGLAVSAVCVRRQML